MKDVVTLKANGKEVSVSGADFEKASKGETPEQLSFTFESQFSDIALKETIRGVKAITREAIRFGATVGEVRLMLDILTHRKPIILAAINAIEESLLD